MRDLGWDPPRNAFEASRGLAACIPIIEKQESSKKEERDKQVQWFGDEAVSMLKRAVARGYKDVRQLKKDKNLDPIRGRADFQKLIADLVKASPASKAPLK